MMKKIVSITVALFLISCTNNTPQTGKVYENKIYFRKRTTLTDSRHKKIASEGYIYSTAAVLGLQNASPNSNEIYNPPRLKFIDKQGEKGKGTGFEVELYELYSLDNSQKLERVIISFVGSNDSKDWIFTNFLGSKKQFEQARQFVQEVVEKYKDKEVEIYSTGYSLGGGLALHVAIHEDTRDKIKEAWIFNPSPRIKIKKKEVATYRDKIWIASTDGEILKFMRRFKKEISSDHKAENFYLINSNFIYDHYRWILGVDILHVADLAIAESKFIKIVSIDSKINDLKKKEFDKGQDIKKLETERAEVLKSEYRIEKLKERKNYNAFDKLILTKLKLINQTKREGEKKNIGALETKEEDYLKVISESEKEFYQEKFELETSLKPHPETKYYNDIMKSIRTEPQKIIEESSLESAD